MKPDYKLLKPLPGIPEGTIYKYNEVAERYWPQIADAPDLTFTEAFMIINKDWFEKMPERIVLKLVLSSPAKENKTYHYIQKGNDESLGFNVEEAVLMEQALNGELYSIEQICEAINTFNSNAAHAEFIANWVRDAIIKKLKNDCLLQTRRVLC